MLLLLLLVLLHQQCLLLEVHQLLLLRFAHLLCSCVVLTLIAFRILLSRWSLFIHLSLFFLILITVDLLILLLLELHELLLLLQQSLQLLFVQLVQEFFAQDWHFDEVLLSTDRCSLLELLWNSLWRLHMHWELLLNQRMLALLACPWSSWHVWH